MASRRFRIRPVANVPIRRGKVSTENAGSDVTGQNVEKEDQTQSEQLETSDTPSVNENDASIVGSHSTEETNKSQENISDVKAVTTASDSVSSTNKSNEVPPGLVRKRMKPAVSIGAVTGRPRQPSVVLNDNKAALVNYNRNNQEESVQQNTVRSENISEVPFCGVKDGGIGVPGITQIIPTGTAIRPQHDSNVGVSTLAAKGESPQSLPEPNLPSEGAGDGYSSVLLKPSSPQVNVIQNSHVLDPHKFLIDSASDSDDSRKTHSSDSLPFCNNSGKVVPEHDGPRTGWHSPHVNDKSEGQKGGSAAHTSESEDELKSCISGAVTQFPSVRKTVETSRGRFVRPAPRFSEASVRRSNTQSNAGKLEEFRKGTSIAASPHKKQADLVSEESVVTPSDSGCLEDGDKMGIQLRHAPSSGMPRLARARREFLNKFKNRTPDRSCLTMFDLIFYNPTTNPMKHAVQVNGNSKISQSLDATGSKIEERLAEEQVDEPMAEEEVNGPVAEGENKNDKHTTKEEDDMAMPVPQVKVGPDGQIVLDEKSLVIETTGARKSREDLANSAVIVDYGTGSTGYGTYSKKHRKSRDWSKEETLKFYRALHTVGTDFLLMQSIFPKRTRQDLKTKFKREDRTNRFLVEKALRCPLKFDLTELEKELEKEEEEERQALLTMFQNKSHHNMKQKKAASKAKGSNRGRGLVSRAMDPGDTGVMSQKKPGNKRKSNELDELCGKEKVRIKQPHKAGKTQLRRGKSCSSSSSDENEHGLEYNYSDELKFATDSFSVDESREAGHNDEASDDDTGELEYLTKPPKPTRSGRVPQRRRLSQVGDDIVTVTKKSRRESSVLVSTKNTAKPVAENQPLEDLTNVEPGSLVVLATQSPTNPGHHVYKVFMVAPNPAGLPNTAVTMPPVTVPLAQALLPLVTDNTPSSQLSGESQPTTE